jgi:hypothetical protein
MDKIRTIIFYVANILFPISDIILINTINYTLSCYDYNNKHNLSIQIILNIKAILSILYILSYTIMINKNIEDRYYILYQFYSFIWIIIGIMCYFENCTISSPYPLHIYVLISLFSNILICIYNCYIIITPTKKPINIDDITSPLFVKI